MIRPPNTSRLFQVILLGSLSKYFPFLLIPDLLWDIFFPEHGPPLDHHSVDVLLESFPCLAEPSEVSSVPALNDTPFLFE